MIHAVSASLSFVLAGFFVIAAFLIAPMLPVPRAGRVLSSLTLVFVAAHTLAGALLSLRYDVELAAGAGATALAVALIAFKALATVCAVSAVLIVLCYKLAALRLRNKGRTPSGRTPRR